MSDSPGGSPMSIDRVPPTGHSHTGPPPVFSTGTAIPQLPPFDPLTFDPDRVGEDLKNEWLRDPDLYPIGQPWPDPRTATSAPEFWRWKNATGVSAAVYHLGKNPYPGLHKRRYVPELNKHTPEYDPCKPWMGGSRALKYITPERLRGLGCINIYLAATASRDPNICTLIGNSENIHPILHRNQFRDTSDFIYEVMKLTLRVVTQMLGMTSVLDLLHALGSPMQRSTGTEMLPDGYWVYYTGRSTEQDRSQTAFDLINLAKYVYFTWHDGEEMNAYAQTNPLDEPGLRGGNNSSACEVRLDTEFRYIMAGGKEMLASLYNPEASDESALLRVQFLMANNIIHELAHVFFLNCTDEPGDCFPFCNDQRFSEEGHVMESVIHANVNIGPNHVNPQHLGMSPFGLEATRWPGIKNHSVKDKDAVKATWAKNGLKYHTKYMVTMRHVRQFFCDEFWKFRETGFGTGPLSTFAIVGVRWLTDAGPEDFDLLETPIARKKDDEHKAGEFYPDLMAEAIVFRHEAFTLAGQKIIMEPVKEATPEDVMVKLGTAVLATEREGMAGDDTEGESGAGHDEEMSDPDDFEGEEEGEDVGEEHDEEEDSNMGEGGDEYAEEEEEGVEEPEARPPILRFDIRPPPEERNCVMS